MFTQVFKDNGTHFKQWNITFIKFEHSNVFIQKHISFMWELVYPLLEEEKGDFVLCITLSQLSQSVYNGLSIGRFKHFVEPCLDTSVGMDNMKHSFRKKKATKTHYLFMCKFTVDWPNIWETGRVSSPMYNLLGYVNLFNLEVIV